MTMSAKRCDSLRIKRFLFSLIDFLYNEKNVTYQSIQFSRDMLIPGIG